MAKGPPLRLSAESREALETAFRGRLTTPYSDEVAAHPGQTTYRLNAKAWEVKAGLALEADPAGTEPYSWLMAPDGRNWRRRLMQELGRLEDPERIRLAARRLCEWQPSAYAGIGWLRRLRGKQAPACTAALARRLQSTAWRYAQEHPDLTAEQLSEAFALVGLAFRSER